MMDGSSSQRDSNRDVGTLTSSISPALRVGALSGALGLLYGGASGILQARPPVARSVAFGVHWFAMGSSFWWLRSTILRSHFEDKATTNQRIYVSALAGGLSGGGASLIFGNRRFVPACLAFSALGCIGQLSYNALDDWQGRQRDRQQQPLMERIANSRWVPLRSLSDEQYKDMLTEKLLTVEAEIALLDEKIDLLRSEGTKKNISH